MRKQAIQSFWTLSIACLLWGFFPSLAFAQQTNWYHFPRRFQIISNSTGGASWYSVFERVDRMTSIVGPFDVISNATYHLHEQEGVAWGYEQASNAWEAATNAYEEHYADHADMICSNAGYLKGTRLVGTNWGAYAWSLQNVAMFQSSTSSLFVSDGGATSTIAAVMVGTIGDYCPETTVADTGPVFKADFPGVGAMTNAVFKPDFTAYYNLVKRYTWQPNDDDSDGDGIPDFADGYDRDSGNGYDNLSINDHFASWKLFIAAVEPTQAWLRITYDDSGPTNVIYSGGQYSVSTGVLRVWKKDAWLARNKAVAPTGDYVSSGEYSVTALGLSPTSRVLKLFIESVALVTNAEISCELDPDGPTGPQEYRCVDRVGESVLKVELKVSHPVSPGPTGSPAKYTNAPSIGSADNLFSTWDNEQFKVNVKLDPSNITSSLPAGFIHWTAAGFSIPDNSTDYTFSWSATGVKEITVEFPSCGITRKIYVDVPDVGPIGQVAAALLLPPPVVALIWGYKTEAEDYTNTNFPAGPQRDAYRHCYWNSLCVSDGNIARDEILLISTAHEYDNKNTYSPPQQAFNSSMDLRNNIVGAYIEHTLIDGEPDRDTIRSDITAAYVVGNLYIWAGGGTQESSEGILVKSDGSKIFPVP